ncbi:hypothetical protein LshimejAT787_0604490 [Lyophyllum shimeji]|uniref:Uncharacterized protein n=1 Tax=Lyophyllum shimeji TaxID=47721 RepID=A0A9P3PQ09_LYOSH|nr:hypothetical protein LshimejAT787_0604490 [Lyophyllum shimeji]
MPGVTKSAPARRQTQRDHATPVVVIPKSQTVKTRSNAYSSPNLYADAHDASSCHVIVREAESSRNVSFEAIRRPDATPRASRGKRQSPATKVTPANHQLSTLLLSDSGPTTPSQSPANPSSVAEHYPFGWNAFPTRAHVNEVCRRFLRGCCPLAANCIRIHPRDDNFREDAPDAKVFVVKLPTQQSSFRPDVRLAPQIDTVSKEPNDVSKPCKLLYPSGVKPGVPLRYDPERGLLLYQADSDRGQTSDSSQHFSAVASPAESSCSLTSEDTEVTTSSTHPPPPSIYLCRHWLMKRCERRYDCPFVHGDLEYEPPVRGVYPPPKSQTRCMRSEQGACSRGYLCMYFHDDLKYGKPFEQTIPSCRSGDGLTNHVSSNPPLDAEATTTPAAKEEKPADNIVGYPPPKSNHFCRYWLLNRTIGPYKASIPRLDIPRHVSSGCSANVVLASLVISYTVISNMTFRSLVGLFSSTMGHLEGPLSMDVPPLLRTEERTISSIPDRAKSAENGHPDLLYGDAPSDTPSSKTALVDDPTKDPPVGMRPPPKSPETCIQWLRDRCSLRYACKYRHDDLEYDPPGDQRSTDNSAPSNIASNHDMSTEVHPWSLRVHDHAKVKLGPGFEILEVATGFETPWLYLTNVPARATADDVADLLRPFGDVLDVKLPSRVNNATMIVRVRFSSPSEARQASTSLNGTQALGGKITARLPVHDASCHRTMLEDTAVRIRWQAPSKVGYGGYSTMEHAKEALAASRKPFRDHYVHASVHVGLPVVGVVTVCFRGVPLEATKADMAWFAKPNDVVWARPNYQSLDLSTQGIKAILQEGGELLDFVVLPPPYKSGAKVQAWAHFSTPSDAKAACRRLHDRKPMFTGKTKVTAEHVQSLTFSIFPGVYAKLSDDIQALCRTLHHSRRIAMSVIQRPTPMPTLVKVFSDDIKELGHFKAEFEAVLKGETVFQGTNVAWDPFFAHPAGKAFVEALECEIPAVTIHVDISRRTIRLLGSSEPRLTVRQRILDKMKELHSQQTHAILLDGRLLGYFMVTPPTNSPEKLFVADVKPVFLQPVVAPPRNARSVSTTSLVRSHCPVAILGVATASLVISFLRSTTNIYH